ncbi:unnamed protein product [Rotaria sp. Silwood2]|nr:unnamed protein product [Rotaria sp. Silwood2]
MEDVLLCRSYPNLCGLGLHNIEKDTALRIFTELHVKLENFTDCLYLLDGRFDSLQKLSLNIYQILSPQIIIDNKKQLPNLKLFSLYSEQDTDKYNELIVPLLHRMINLEELDLHLVVYCEKRFIDGYYLKYNIINNLLRLNKFVFNIRSCLPLNDQVYLSSNEDCQLSLNSFKNNKIISCVDYFQDHKEGQCHIYSYPYQAKYYEYITNNFPDGLFKYIREVSLYDQRPFEHEFFKLKSCSVTNAGPLARFPIAIIKPINVNAQTPSLKFNSLTFKAAQIRRHFLQVPTGSNIVVLKMTNDSSDISAQRNLHFVQLEPGRSFRLTGFEKIIRLSSHSTFQCYFNVQDKRTLKLPNKDESKIQILSKRDCLTKQSQIYQLILGFYFSLLKASEIQVKCPYLHKLLYDNEYEAVLWMSFDANKQYLGSGDVMKNYSLKLEKDDFVIRMNIRYDKQDLLERLLKYNGGIGLALHMEHKKSSSNSVNSGNKKQVTPPTITTEEGTPNSSSSQKDQQYQEALRDLKISGIQKLIDDQSKLYEELISKQQDLNNHIPLHIARLQQLENQLKQ